jgi:hypothetical protein
LDRDGERLRDTGIVVEIFRGHAICATSILALLVLQLSFA